MVPVRSMNSCFSFIWSPITLSSSYSTSYRRDDVDPRLSLQVATATSWVVRIV